MSSGAVLDREAIARACRAHDVRRLRLFGSAASDRFRPEHSDVDILVDFNPGTPDPFDAYFGLKEDLECDHVAGGGPAGASGQDAPPLSIGAFEDVEVTADDLARVRACRVQLGDAVLSVLILSDE